MLQERGSVLVRAKIRSVDGLVRMRGRCFLSFYQNFGDVYEQIKVEGEVVEARGIDFAESRFNYVVESGSTVAKTQAQTIEQSLQLFQVNAIDRPALLEALNWPNWKAVCERMAESDVAAAIDILIQAGLPPVDAEAIRAFVMQPGQMAPGVGQQPAGKPGAAKPSSGAPNASGGGSAAPGKDVTAKAGAPAKPGVPKAMQGVAQ